MGKQRDCVLERVWQQKERIFCGLVEPLTMKRASCCVCADEDKDEGAEKGKKIGLRICGCSILILRKILDFWW